MRHDKEKRVRVLLSQAGSAHGEYETRELNGVYDESWPDWYAAYLVRHGLGDLLGQDIKVAELTVLLKECDEAYRRERPGIDWPDYYSTRIVPHWREAQPATPHATKDPAARV